MLPHFITIFYFFVQKFLFGFAMIWFIYEAAFSKVINTIIINRLTLKNNLTQKSCLQNDNKNTFLVGHCRLLREMILDSTRTSNADAHTVLSGVDNVMSCNKSPSTTASSVRPYLGGGS